MKLLIIEPCGFTRLGMFSCLIKNETIDIIDTVNINKAIPFISQFMPDVILVNMTTYSHDSNFTPELIEFLKFRNQCKIYCYIDAIYPVNDTPIPICSNVFILNKQSVTILLEDIVTNTESYFSYVIPFIPRSIFSDQEILVMNYWMSETPNYRIARKLGISNRTVYVHKRHLAKKIKVRNRLEFCFIYNVIKYLFWPIDHLATVPISRQTREDILALYK